MEEGFECEICATVPTGLEYGAADECREVLGRGARVKQQRGRVSFLLRSLQELEKVSALRSVDNYHVVIGELPDFCREEATVLQRLELLPSEGTVKFETGLRVWRHYHDVILPRDSTSAEAADTDTTSDSVPNTNTGVSGMGMESEQAVPGIVQAETGNETESASLSGRVQTDPPSSAGGQSSTVECQSPVTFRVTCTRGGRKHCFSSMEAASKFGSGLNSHFGWRVKLKDPDLEVLLNIADNSASIGLALNKESRYKRNIVEFGPTTLRATIAYGILRLANLKPGDVIVDPMCGGGSISIEGSLAWGNTYHLAADNHELAAPRTLANFKSINERRERNGRGGVAADVLQWDVRSLPLRTASVDVIVTDMPFGKKSGTRVANWQLYPLALQEFGRVCRPSTSRAVLLTHDTKVMAKVVQQSVFWKRHRTLWINIGGLTAGLYLLQRTKAVHSAALVTSHPEGGPEGGAELNTKAANDD